MIWRKERFCTLFILIILIGVVSGFVIVDAVINPLDYSKNSNTRAWNDADTKSQPQLNTDTGLHTNAISSGPIHIYGDESLRSYEFPGSGTEKDPYIISGYDISGNEDLLTVRFTQLWVVIEDNYLHDGEYWGIDVVESENVVIRNNIIHNMGFDGLRVFSSNNIQIINNEIINSKYKGIRIDTSSDNLIQNNYIENAGEAGIYLQDHSNSNVVNDNQLVSNEVGIEIGADKEAKIGGSYNKISENEIAGGFNGIVGIVRGIVVRDKSFFNIIEYNIVSYALMYGISIEGESEFNEVKNNGFINNNHVQGYDGGSNNLFSHNFWSDWTGPDADGDGIVDLPYVIDGSNSDEKPRVSLESIPFPVDNEIGNLFDKIPIGYKLIISMVLIMFAVALGLKFLGINPFLRGRSPLNLHHPRNGTSPSVIKELFKSQTTLYYVLLGQDITQDEELQNKIEERVPKRLFDYKFLFNPIRLSMAKLLFENLEMTSIELKEILEISWNDYSHHIRALERKGYLKIWDDFSDGNKRQKISLQPKGVQEYMELIDLLQLFLDNTTEYQYTLNKMGDEQLYPKRSNIGES